MRGVPRSVSAIAPVFVSAALLFCLAYFVDYRGAWDHIRTIPMWSLLGATAAFLFNIGVNAWRYALVVEDVSIARPSLRQVLPISFLSLFLTYLMPIAVLADVARIAASCRMLKLGPAEATRCVIHDRLLALAGLVLSATLVLPLLVRHSAPPWAILTTVALMSATAGGLAVIGFVSLKGVNSSWRVLRIAAENARQFMVHFSTAPQLFRQAVCALAVTLGFALQLYLLASALDIALPPVMAIVYAPLISLAQVVPFLYGGYGAREAAVVALLGGISASPEAALALGLAIGFTNMVASLPGVLAAGRLLSPSAK